MKRIAILGSTGSIGTQTLDVIQQHPDRFQAVALAAGYNVDLLLKQIDTFKPQMVSVATKQLAGELRHSVPRSTRIYYGPDGLLEIAAQSNADFVMSSLVGSQGLMPTIAAIKAGKAIGLANKETLISAGHIINKLVAQHKVKLIPVDSEHSAIYQCLNGESREEVSRIILTASGGSFRDLSRDELHGVTVEQALAHPNWSMGAKITIDSATMVNKGLEVIEAHWLFNMSYDQIEVVIHPQSIIHSLVEFADHSVIAQLGYPDMRVPIQYAMSWPERIRSASKPLNLLEVGQLDFEPMDVKRFPCLQLAYDSGRAGGTAPTVFNAANEIAVARFLQADISFLNIEAIIYEVLAQHHPIADPSLEEIKEADQWARQYAEQMRL